MNIKYSIIANKSPHIGQVSYAIQEIWKKIQTKLAQKNKSILLSTLENERSHAIQICTPKNRMSSVKTRSWVNTTCRTNVSIVVCTTTWYISYTLHTDPALYESDGLNVSVWVLCTVSMRLWAQWVYSVNRINAIHMYEANLGRVLKGSSNSSWDNAIEPLWIENVCVYAKERKKERKRDECDEWVYVCARDNLWRILAAFKQFHSLGI